MKTRFIQVLCVLISSFMLCTVFSCSSCSKPQSTKQKASSSSSKKGKANDYKKAKTTESLPSESLGRRAPRGKVKGLEGQSTRMDEGNLAKPGGNRVIEGLDGLDLSKDSESQ
jgi:hypothetical protein